MNVKKKQVIPLFISIIILLFDLMPVEAADSANENRIQISKTVSSKSVDNIKIDVSACEVLIDNSSSDNFEIIFSYPKELASQMKNFDLLAKKDENELSINTEYNNDNISGVDENAPFKLTIKIPDKEYSDISIKLITCDNSIINLNVKASKVTVTSKAGNTSLSTDRAYDKFIINNKSGDFTLNLKNMGKETSIINNIGQFILSVDHKPINVKLCLDNFFKYNEYGKYKIPADWSLSKEYNTKKDGKRYESITAQKGNGTNVVNVSNTVGGFIFQTKAIKYQGNIQ